MLDHSERAKYLAEDLIDKRMIFRVLVIDSQKVGFNNSVESGQKEKQDKDAPAKGASLLGRINTSQLEHPYGDNCSY
ncbi:hypothetical protein BDZ89DRAFT_1070052 [Hymenopellis radicata]|nr:hypothetical protein BDZ89DRAFT_1070052 [Hymenopellis radicata]